MRTVDAAGNISALSNVICAGVCAPPVVATTAAGRGLPNTARGVVPATLEDTLAMLLVALVITVAARKVRSRDRADPGKFL